MSFVSFNLFSRAFTLSENNFSTLLIMLLLLLLSSGVFIKFNLFLSSIFFLFRSSIMHCLLAFSSSKSNSFFLYLSISSLNVNISFARTSL